MRSADGRFEIQEERTDSHDHYMKSDYEHRVVEVATGKVLARWSESYEGSFGTGAHEVVFSEDETAVLVTFHDGTTGRFELPR